MTDSMVRTTDSLPGARPADPASPTHMRRAPAREYDAILFASFGGPEGQEDVIPFLRNVTRGRGIPDERLEEVAGHYRALGGVSPITAQNRDLIARLEVELASRGIDLPVHFGNRNWSPFVGEVVRHLHAEGKRNVLGIVTSAYSSYSSCRQYREDFGMALRGNGLHETQTDDPLRIDKVRVYFDHPGFLDPVADGLRTALAELAAEGVATDRIRVLFSTHSVPLSMAQASGPAETRREGSGGWYVDQHLAGCRHVVEQLGSEMGGARWQLVFQSRSGAPHIPWLEPDVNDVIEQLAGEDEAEAVVVVPIGFVTDHVEVIWDLDTEARETAAEHGLGFRRVATSGSDPRFVAALADLVQERLDPDFPRREATDFGPTPDLCGPDCCTGRLCRPTTSAVDSADDVERAIAEGTDPATGTDPAATTGGDAR